MKNTKKIPNILVTLLLVGSGFLFSQNPEWTLPPKQYQVGSGSPPSSLPTFAAGYLGLGTPTFSCHNSMIDVSNNIKFFIVDENVYKSNGDLMVDDFTNLPTGMYTPNGSPQASGNSEICIVPDPANCTKYYIFSSALLC